MPASPDPSRPDPPRPDPSRPDPSRTNPADARDEPQREPQGDDRIDSLPLDPDLDDTAAGADPPTPLRAVHLSGRFVALVGAGGAAGTLARYLLTGLAGRHGMDSAAATFVINVTGCLLIGILLELLARLGPDHGRRRAARLLLGTGVLGGFTTYSTLAEVVASSLDARHLAEAAGYGLLSVAAGLVACTLGIALARLHPGTTHPDQAQSDQRQSRQGQSGQAQPGQVQADEPAAGAARETR